MLKSELTVCLSHEMDNRSVHIEMLPRGHPSSQEGSWKGSSPLRVSLTRFCKLLKKETTYFQDSHYFIVAFLSLPAFCSLCPPLWNYLFLGLKHRPLTYTSEFYYWFQKWPWTKFDSFIFCSSTWKLGVKIPVIN